MMFILVVVFLILEVRSQYSYETPIEITNPASKTQILPTEVLVSIDTASWIRAGKLQTDCEDMKFVKGENFMEGQVITRTRRQKEGPMEVGKKGNPIPFFIEGNCNTNFTQVWLSVGNLAANSTSTIYVQHGTVSASYHLNDPDRIRLQFNGSSFVNMHYLPDSNNNVVPHDACPNNGSIFMYMHQPIYPEGSTIMFGRYPRGITQTEANKKLAEIITTETTTDPMDLLNGPDDSDPGGPIHEHSVSQYFSFTADDLHGAGKYFVPSADGDVSVFVSSSEHFHNIHGFSFTDEIPMDLKRRDVLFCETDGLETRNLGDKPMLIFSDVDNIANFTNDDWTVDIDMYDRIPYGPPLIIVPPPDPPIENRRFLENVEGTPCEGCHKHYIPGSEFTFDTLPNELGSGYHPYYEGTIQNPKPEFFLAYREHIHGVSGSTSDIFTETNPPYMTLVPFNNTQTSAMPFPGMISMVSSDIIPPLGWEELSLLNGDMLFPRGGPVPGVFGGESQHRHIDHKVMAGKTHNTVQLTFPNEAPFCQEIRYDDNCTKTLMELGDVERVMEVVKYDHAHLRYDGMTGYASNIPTYRKYVFVKRKKSVVAKVMVEETSRMTWKCFGLFFDDDDVCSKNGVCGAPNECECFDEMFGKKCQEKIPGKGKYASEVLIEITYEMPVGEIGPEMETDFDCALIIIQANSLLGPKAICNWKTSSLLDTALLIVRNVKSSRIDQLSVIPVTSVSRTDAIPVAIEMYPTLWERMWAVFVFVPTGVVGATSFLCLFALLLILCVIVNTMKLKKYKDLDERDVEIILQEQKAEEESGNIAKLKINKKLFEIKYDSLKVLKKIGEGGSSSVVFKCKWKGKICAFKCFKTNTICSSQEKFSEFEQEVQILASVAHPNILRFLGATLNPPRVGIVMEYCEKGDIKQFLLKQIETHGNPISVPEKLRILDEISSSMTYLHSKNIIHRDLKSENVLINRNNVTKLMDFGLSKVVERISQTKTKRIGTSIYMAPEVTKGEQYSEKCDVFSFSILIWEVLHDDFMPFGENAPYNLEFKVAANEDFRPEIDPSRFSDCKWLITLMKTCWKHLAGDRPSFQKIMDNIQKNTEGKGGRAVPIIPGRRKKELTEDQIMDEMEKVSVENDRLLADIEKMKQQL